MKKFLKNITIILIIAVLLTAFLPLSSIAENQGWFNKKSDCLFDKVGEMTDEFISNVLNIEKDNWSQSYFSEISMTIKTENTRSPIMTTRL